MFSKSNSPLKLSFSIPICISSRHDLSQNDKMIFGEIYTLWNATGSFFMSNNELGKKIARSKRTVINSINHLKSKKLIFSKIIPKKGKSRKRFIQVNTTLLVNNVVQKLTPPSCKNLHPRSARSCNIDNTIEYKRDSAQVSKEPSNSIPQNFYKSVINYLNNKTGKHFNYRSKANQRLIKARFNEGNSLDDFKAVIDNKVYDWNDSQKMNKYLRPSTLFNGKFDNYLNEYSSKQCKKPTISADEFIKEHGGLDHD